MNIYTQYQYVSVIQKMVKITQFDISASRFRLFGNINTITKYRYFRNSSIGMKSKMKSEFVVNVLLLLLRWPNLEQRHFRRLC